MVECYTGDEYLSKLTGNLAGHAQCRSRQNVTSLSKAIIFSATFAFAVGTPMAANAQKFSDLKSPNSPLILQAVGSFYVGGRAVSMTAVETGIYGGGPLIVDQMYVQYMIPRGHAKPAVVMVHGSTLSGKSYETTPDGRMGWYEYFARKGYPSYVVDQVARARSGFDQGPFNDVRAGLAKPDSQPTLRRASSDTAWVAFRVGPVASVKFADTQFPADAAEELAKQAVPDLSQSLPLDNPNYSALSELAKDLKSAVLIGHSQAGRYPFEAALLDPQGIRALIAVEPAGCKSSEYSDVQIAKLSRLPILVIFGDHLDTPDKIGATWNERFKDCQVFVARINAAKGNITMAQTAALGFHGNSHMLMQDKNNLQIADLIMKWMHQHSE